MAFSRFDWNPGSCVTTATKNDVVQSQQTTIQKLWVGTIKFRCYLYRIEKAKKISSLPKTCLLLFCRWHILFDGSLIFHPYSLQSSHEWKWQTIAKLNLRWFNSKYVSGLSQQLRMMLGCISGIDGITAECLDMRISEVSSGEVAGDLWRLLGFLSKSYLTLSHTHKPPTSSQCVKIQWKIDKPKHP